MIDCYKTDRESLRQALEKADKYNSLMNRINKGIKKHRTLAKATKNEDYKLAYSMLADYMSEIKKE